MSNFTAERTVIRTANFERRQLEDAVRENTDFLRRLATNPSAGGAEYKAAVERLVRLKDDALADGQLSRDERLQLRKSLQDAARTREIASRGMERFALDGGPANRPGGLRDGGVLPAPPPAERDRATPAAPIQRADEPGVRRDPVGFDVVGRDPGALTARERADQAGPYATSGKAVYTPAAKLEQVEAGVNALREGDHGPAVKELQKRLIDAGYDVGKHGADGFFGPQTRKAYDRFLADQGSARSDAGTEELARLGHLTREANARRTYM